MPTKIKLMRRGKMRQPYYRIVVADSRTKRDGRSIEEIGKYHPKEDPSYMEVDAERIAYWLGVGAQPTDAVRAILKVTGDWQKFYGEPAPEPMRVKAAKPDRRAAFEAATQHAAGEPDAEATTPKKKAAPKAATQPEPQAGDSAADESAAAAPASTPDGPADDASDESPVAAKAAPAKAESSTAEEPEPAAEAKPKAAAKAAPKAAAKSADKPAAGPADDSAEPVAAQDSDA